MKYLVSSVLFLHCHYLILFTSKGILCMHSFNLISQVPTHFKAEQAAKLHASKYFFRMFFPVKICHNKT